MPIYLWIYFFKKKGFKIKKGDDETVSESLDSFKTLQEAGFVKGADELQISIVKDIGYEGLKPIKNPLFTKDAKLAVKWHVSFILLSPCCRYCYHITFHEYLNFFTIFLSVLKQFFPSFSCFSCDIISLRKKNKKTNN